MFKTLKKILTLLTLGENKKLFWLFIAIFFMGILDLVGVASIFPFLTVISNPEVIQTSSKLKWIYERFAFAKKEDFLIALGAASFIILLVCNVFRSLTTLAITRFGGTKRCIISERLLSQYLYEPYVLFLNRNSAILTNYIISEVNTAVSGVLVPCIQVVARIFLVVLIFIVLFVANPWMALFVIGAVGGGYFVIYLSFRTRLFNIGKGLSDNSSRMYKSLYEAFGGIKDIKIRGKEEIFIEQYAKATKGHTDCYSWWSLIAMLPRYAFEIISFGAIMFIAIFITVIRRDQQQVIPFLGLYALAAYRLMPAIQQIYQDFTSIRSSLPALQNVYRDFSGCPVEHLKMPKYSFEALSFSKQIELRGLTFQYPQAREQVIKNFNLIIRANTTVGLVGGSGAGKTTLIDILLGLLHPQQGELLVDGQIIDEHNLRSWQANIGYVPQHIYLCDDTVTRNIAFGVPDQKIDHEAVKNAAKLANIDDFIVNELSYGYDTEIGERGVRLSGGQRQRIGIARAVYHNPSLLVFDEATSALDGITEEVILEAINNLTHKKTIIIIAHRFSTVKQCDVIYMLEWGKIVGQGTYAQLLENNEQFRQMAKVGPGKNG